MTDYSLYALLWLNRDSEEEISDLLRNRCGIDKEYIQRGMHLTIYHSKKKLIGIEDYKSYRKIKADVKETRFMVFAPGGENPREDINPNNSSVGIRLTRRNIAIPEIIKLRRSIYKNEDEIMLKGRRNQTSDWKNSFGSSHFQAHIKMIRPGSNINKDLTLLGKILREELKYIYFNKFEIKQNY
tara:strand:+ start:81 stop:632 length:552 start_codon:yes stop_codon:yes gene_type:complete